MYKAEALFDFTAQQDGDLTITRGDVLNVLSEQNRLWCKVEKKVNPGKSGMVPLSYISPIDPTKEQREVLRALYDFKARNSFELGFKEGDFVTVINRDPSRNWWQGEINGHRGIVPSNYLESCAVQSLESGESLQPKPASTAKKTRNLRSKRLSLMISKNDQPNSQQRLKVPSFDLAEKLDLSVKKAGPGKMLSRSVSSSSLDTKTDPIYASYPFAEPDSKENSFYRDGEFVGGNIYKIIEYLTLDTKPMDEKRIGEIKCFVLAYKMSITPEQLMQCITSRFNVPEGLKYPENRIKTIKVNTLRLLHEWIEGCYTDDIFNNPKVKSDLDTFLNGLKEDPDPQIKKSALQNLQLTNLCAQKAAFINTSPKCIPQAGDVQLSNRVDICDLTPLEFVQQLALVEHDILQRISSNEFLHCAWMKKDAEKTSPNITHMTKIFNNVGHWFEESILLASGNTERQKFLKFIIGCAKACLELNEFNGLMTFVCTTQSRNISRLSKIWKSKLKEESDQLTNMIMASNFKEIRKLQEEKSPCIPYMAITLRDVTFIDDGNPNYIQDTNLINWEKLRMLGNSINKLSLSRKGAYNNIAVNNKIIGYIRNMSYTMSEDEAYNKSLEIEPKKNYVGK